MAYFETINARYGPVRKLESPDWNHADVFNATLGQMVANSEAVRSSTSRIKNIRISKGDWSNNQFRIENENIQEDSLCDVYYANASKEMVLDANIDGATVDGALILTCDSVPGKEIVIDCVEIRNEVSVNAGAV